ncbi:MAG: dUTP diphosphatase [Actinobacteria bacterium]|nr:dUTP diphosphatase [Actinomycetota bacterium]
MNVARTKGFIRDEGLDLEVTDFGSGAKGLQALIGRNVDMTIGVYEHTIRMQAKGMDIRSVVLHSNAPGIAIAIPKGYAGFVLPRSGNALKHGLSAANSPGLIDSLYRGELKVILLNTDPTRPYHVHRGDRIAQLVIQKVEEVRWVEVDELDANDRGGGFGHSGR